MSPWSLDESVFRWIEGNIGEDAKILEFGSGDGTERLAKKFQVTSIEDNEKFLNKYDSRYIHAPIVNGWYDVNALKCVREKPWDLVIIDGPAGHIGHGRIRIMLHFHFLGLHCGCPIIVDDTNRDQEKSLAEQLASLGYDYTTIKSTNSEKFAAVLVPQTDISWAFETE